MPDIIQRLRDAYAENPASALKLLPKLFQAADNGKIVELPCKRGDTVYRLCGRKGQRFVAPREVLSVTFAGNATLIFSTAEDVLDKTVFLTRESAEKALKERSNSD